MRYSDYTEPDPHKYEPKPIEDVDVPDLESPDPIPPGGVVFPSMTVTGKGGGGGSSNQMMPPAKVGTVPSLNGNIDPAEHAAHAFIEALTTLEQQIVLTTDLERAWFLKDLTKRAWQHVDLVNGKALAQIDVILERRR